MQTAMLRLAPASGAEAEHAEHSGHHGAPGGDEAGQSAFACAICAAALLPGAVVEHPPHPGPRLVGSATVAPAAEAALQGQAPASPFARGPPRLS